MFDIIEETGGGGVIGMTEKRFTDDGVEEIIDQSFTDNLTGKTYWIDNGLDEIVDLLNTLHEENEQLKKENERLLMENRRIKIQW